MRTKSRGPSRSVRLAWRARELADAYGLSPTTVYSWIAAGLLPATQPGGGVLLILDADWRRFLASHRVGDAPLDVERPSIEPATVTP